MFVNLQRGWFGPDGVLYTPRDNPLEVPDSWKDKLPKSAQETDGPEEEKPTAKSAAAKK